MSKLENKFEESWQKAFDDASVPPPERVWEGIESHLDRAVPLPSSKSNKRYYLLASLLLLLVLSTLGWMFWNTGQKNIEQEAKSNGHEVGTKEQAVKEQVTKSTEQVATGTEQEAIDKGQEVRVSFAEQSKNKEQRSTANKISKNEIIKSTNQPSQTGQSEELKHTSETSEKAASFVAKQPSTPIISSPLITSQPSHKQGKKEIFSGKKVDNTVTNQELLIAKVAKSSTITPSEPQSTISSAVQQLPPNQTQQPQAPNEVVVASESIFTAIKRENWMANYLKNKSLAKVAFVLPTVSISNQPPSFIKPASKRHLDWWLGINLMINRFNPNTIIDDIAISSVTAVNSISGFNALVGQKPFSISKPGNSYLIGFQAGVAVSKHVFIESGVQYWRGNSWLESDALIMNRLDSKRADLYNSFLANDQVIPVFSRQNVLLPTNSPYRVQNVYEYLSIPLRVGYRLQPFRKIETSMLAGVSGDFFQKSTIYNQTTNLSGSTEYTRQDHWYRNLSLSGLVGVGVSYNLMPRWQVSADAQYRHALLDGVNQPSAVHSRPTQWAIGLGLKRHF